MWALLLFVAGFFHCSASTAAETYLEDRSGKAEPARIDLEVKEQEVEIDHQGNKFLAWTFNGQIPGPFMRVTEGDPIAIRLKNPSGNRASHSLELHVPADGYIEELIEVKPGKDREFTFKTTHPGLFLYHCASPSRPEHLARGMYGAILVDPKTGYHENDFPKPDREYLLVQGQYFQDAKDQFALLENRGWSGSLINGKRFHYDPHHDAKARRILLAKPGERVRILFVNANLNLPVALHLRGGIWERVYVGGNPKNVLYGLQTHNIAVGSGDILDILTPADRPITYTIVDHALGAELRGASTVLMVTPDADDESGRGSNILFW